MQHLEIRLSGTGGQGLILGALVLAEALIAEGHHVAQSQAFEPVSRGGVSRSDVVAAPRMPGYPLVTALDFLLILDACAIRVSQGLVRAGGVVLTDEERVPEFPDGAYRRLSLPLAAAARQAGNVRVTNMVALGALATVGGLCAMETLATVVRSSVPPAYLDASLAALEAGATLAAAG